MGLYDFGNTIISEGIDYSQKGDFLGFTIGGIHSSELGIIRISDNNRYNEDLIPELSDITATSIGLDKTYYFGSSYTQKKFNIKFAFDNLTEIQLRRLRQIFSKKEPQDLIFDEAPYKVYSVKVESPPQLSYLCFDENYKRIYKGEGAVNFIAYYPFAYSRFKYLEDYNIQNIPEWGGIEDNKSDWIESSGIISKNTAYVLYIDDEHDPIENFIDANHDIEKNIRKRQFIPIKNSGDLETNIKIKIELSGSLDSAGIDENTRYGIVISLGHANSLGKSEEDIGKIELKIKPYELKKDSAYLEVDTEKELIFYCKNNSKNIYNNNIISGNFFKIPKTEKDEFLILKLQIESLDDNIDANYRILGMSVNYNYLYY